MSDKEWMQDRLPMIEGVQIPEFFHTHVCQMVQVGSCARLTFGAETTIDGHAVLEPVVRLVGPWDLFLEGRLHVTRWVERACRDHYRDVGLH